MSFRLRGPRSPFDDPYLYLRFLYTGRAVLFDLGELTVMTARDLLRVTDVFVSHAHMDHFVGFDRLLRLHLHRTGLLNMYGPADFADRVEGRLKGFTWNLTQDYPLSMVVHELDGGAVRKTAFRAATGFVRENLDVRTWNGFLLDEPRFRVSAQVLDHGIQCLGFRLQERQKVKILSGELARRGLVSGPWLSAFKEAVLSGEPPTLKVRAPGHSGAVTTSLAELKGIHEVTEGNVVAYVVDAADTGANRRKIITLAQRADVLYIEAAFSAEDADLARERRHLTARAAGELAAEAEATRLRLIHLSPRYEDRQRDLLEEARSGAGPGVTVEGGWRERHP